MYLSFRVDKWEEGGMFFYYLCYVLEGFLSNFVFILVFLERLCEMVFLVFSYNFFFLNSYLGWRWI